MTLGDFLADTEQCLATTESLMAVRGVPVSNDIPFEGLTDREHDLVLQTVHALLGNVVDGLKVLIQ